MSSTESTEERFVNLETKVAYQDKLLADLNDVLLERSRELDKLQARVQQLEHLLREGSPNDPSHERPPHY